jgi:hypothetical protein
MVGEIPSVERDDPSRIAELNSVIRSVARANSDTVSVIDWADFACPDGTPRTDADGRELRPDGIHTDAETTPIVWEWLLSDIGQLDAPAP